MYYDECKAWAGVTNWDELTEYIAQSHPCYNGWIGYANVSYLSIAERWSRLLVYRNWIRNLFWDSLGADYERWDTICNYLGILNSGWSGEDFEKFWEFINEYL